jgi:outer membrane murein-binding lipoprotein Lpp
MTYPGSDSLPEQPTPRPSGIPTQGSSFGGPSYPAPSPTPQYPAPPAGYPTTASVPPVPGPPSYDPAAMAQQYSGPPISGPYGYMPPPPPPPRRRVGTVILSVLTTLLLLATGVVTTLYVLKTQDANSLKRQSTEQNATIASQQDKIDSLQSDLDASKRDAADAKSQLDEMTTQKNIVAGCVNAIDAYGTEVAKSGQNSTASKAKLAALDKACTEAEKYL